MGTGTSSRPKSTTVEERTPGLSRLTGVPGPTSAGATDLMGRVAHGRAGARIPRTATGGDAAHDHRVVPRADRVRPIRGGRCLFALAHGERHADGISVRGTAPIRLAERLTGRWRAEGKEGHARRCQPADLNLNRRASLGTPTRAQGPSRATGTPHGSRARPCATPDPHVRPCRRGTRARPGS